jgi:putative cell wall-binding protein
MRAALGISLSVTIALLGLSAPTSAWAAGESSGTTASIHLAAATNVSRYSGADRYDVAINVASEYSPGVPVLYVAKGTDYPDALSAAPAAAAQGGPLLLTLPDTLIPRVRAEIARLQPAKIVVVGGEAAVSAAVYRDLVTLSGSVTRIGGADRYETSRNLVDSAFGSTGASRVYLATGSNFPDALAAGAVAGGMHAAVILVDGKAMSIDAPTSALIKKLHPTDGAIAGGPVSVSTGIENSLSTVPLPGGWQRFTGADRYATATNINLEAFDFSDTVYMATGTNFPDALTGAVLAGSRHAPLFLVPGQCATPGVVAAIRSLSPTRIVVFGGPNAVADAAQNLVECVAAPPVVAPPVVAPPVVAPPVNPPTGNPGDTKNCGDFANWRDAQNWFEKYYPQYGDVAKLDGNNDRVACESLPGHR